MEGPEERGDVLYGVLVLGTLPYKYKYKYRNSLAAGRVEFGKSHTFRTITMAVLFLFAKGLLIVATTYLFYALVASLRSPLRKIPGPVAAQFTRLWYFNRVRHGRFNIENTALHRKYGPLVRLAPDYVSIDDPSSIKGIYGIASKYPKSDWYQSFKAPDPKLFTLFGDQDIKRHAESRRSLQHVYSMSSLVSYEPFVDHCADLLVQRLSEIASHSHSHSHSGRRPFDIANWLLAYANDVIACITFGSRFGFLDAGQDIRNMNADRREIVLYSSLMGIYPRIHDWIFYPSARLGLFGSQARVEHMDFIKSRMALRAEERKLRDPEAQPKAADEDGPRDFMDRLWDKHDANPEKTLQYHIFMVGLANINAGSDTTASTLSSMLHLILSHPRVQTKLKEEIRDFTASGRLSHRPSFKESQQMPYLNAVLKEALRLHPAVGLPLWRVVPEGGVHIAGHFLPQGTNVGVNAWVAHRNQAVWGPDAEEFRPERWLEAQAEADAGNKEKLQSMEASFLAFGLGSRTCIGKHISILEVLKLMPRLLRDFEIELANPGEQIDCDDYWFMLPNKVDVTVRDFSEKTGF